MKDLIFVLILTILPLFSNAQSKESDELFKHGIELYNSGNYVGAASEFSKAYDLDLEQMDSTDIRRGYSQSWMAHSLYMAGDKSRAVEIDRRYYRVKPQDRRLTREMDSLSMSIEKDMESGRFYLALSNIREMDAMENELCDSLDLFHAGTYGAFSAAFFQTNQLDSALYYLEKKYRIEKESFEKCDTILFETLGYILNLSNHIKVRQYEKTLKYIIEAEEIVAYNNLKRSPLAADLSNLRMQTYILLNQDNKVNEYVNTFIESQHLCYTNDRQKLIFILRTMMDILSQTNNNTAKVKISAALLSCYDKSDIENYSSIGITHCLNLLDEGSYNEACVIIDELINISKAGGTNVHNMIYGTAMCMKALSYMVSGKYDVALECCDIIKKESLENFLEKKSPLYVAYISAKIIPEIMSENYEAAISTLKEVIDYEKQLDNDKLVALAALQAIAGYHKEAMDTYDRFHEYYLKNVIEPQMSYRVDKDLHNIDSAIQGIDNFYRHSHLTDSASYLLKGFKANLIDLKVELCSILPDYLLNEKYINSLIEYAWELKSQKKYVEAREVMDAYLCKWHDLYSKYDQDVIDEYNIYGIFSALYALEETNFHKFRIKMYEKGDPKGIKAHQDYVDFMHEMYDGNTNEEIINALIELYRYTDNHEELAKLLLSQEDINLKSIKELAGEYKFMGDTIHWIECSKAYIKGMLEDSIQVTSQYDITYVIQDLVKYWYSCGKENESLKYYNDELYPILKTLDPQYARKYFFFSLSRLKGYVSNDQFEEMVDEFVQSNIQLFDQRHRVLLQIVKSDVLRSIAGYSNKALEYLEYAYSLTNDTTVKAKVLFCKFEILNSDYNRREECIEVGKVLDSLFMERDSLQTYAEHAEFMHSYIRELKYAKLYNLAKQKATSYLSEHPQSTGNEVKLLKDFDEEDLLCFCRYSDNTSGLTPYFIREELADILMLKNEHSNATVNLAFALVKDELGILNTSIRINSFHDYQIDDLIGYSSKFANDLQSDSLLMYAYDMALLCKGIQLRSYNTVMTMIRKSGHRTLIAKANELMDIIGQMEKTTGDELKLLADRRKKIESDLYSSSSMFGDYQKRLYASWKDVKSHLTKNDIAIEFTSSKDDEGKSLYACILSTEHKLPRVTRLCSIDSLKKCINLTSNNKDVSSLIWHPLAKYISKKKNIYMSPIGILNDIPMESLPYYADTTKFMSDVFSIYRLSSTRELIPGDMVEGVGGVVYGGLKYNTSVKTLESDSYIYPELRVRSNENFATFYKQRDMRGAIALTPYLMGTKTEANQIFQSMQASSIPANIYLDDKGTEASFKSINGKKKRIIHIATHGFYFSEEESQAMFNDYRTNDKQRSTEDNAMMRSGLLFAGADNLLTGETIPDGVEDGILTSHEISTLDLTGLDLVTLSACETAKGDITGDGVFGLQRGFKKAGANSILMSLWKVDDEATCKLMTEFYSNWIGKKMTKHDALEAAKKTVRETKGWEDPKYWAAFILLDGLD